MHMPIQQVMSPGKLSIAPHHTDKQRYRLLQCRREAIKHRLSYRLQILPIHTNLTDKSLHIVDVVLHITCC